MKEYALILIGTILVNNFVLVKFLGLCPFMGVSRKLETAMGMGLATTFVLTLSSICAYLADEYLLAPLGLEYLRTIAFILVIAVVVQFTEMVVHKTSPLLYQVLGIYLPLITTNCAVLGWRCSTCRLGTASPNRVCTVSGRRSAFAGDGAVRGHARAASRWRMCWCRFAGGDRFGDRRADVAGVHGFFRSGQRLKR